LSQENNNNNIESDIINSSEATRLGTLSLFDSIKSSIIGTDTEQINVGCFCSSFPSKQQQQKSSQFNRNKINASLGLNDIENNMRDVVVEEGVQIVGGDIPEELDQGWVTFDLIGPEVVLNLTVIGMTHLDDFSNFGFEAKYEFISESEYSSFNRILDCKLKCPELNFCISPDLWCDGIAHCPSGYDELPSQCRRYKMVWVASVTAVIALVVGLLVAAGILIRFKLIQRKRMSRHHKHNNNRNMMLPTGIPIHFGRGIDGMNLYHQPHPVIQHHHPTSTMSRTIHHDYHIPSSTPFRCSTASNSSYLRTLAHPQTSSRSSEEENEQHHDFLPSEREFDFRAFRSGTTTGSGSTATTTASSASSGAQHHQIPVGTLPHPHPHHRPGVVDQRERITPLIESAQTLRHNDPARHTRLDRQAIEAHYLRWVNSLDSY